MRLIWVGLFAFAALVVVAVVATNLRNDDDDPQEAATAQPETTVELPFDRCVDDLQQTYNEALDHVDPTRYIFATYGTEDPRGQFLVALWARTENRTFQVGRDQAAEEAGEEVAAYCADNAVADGY